MHPTLTNSDLQSNFTNVEFALKTQRQIIKDFGTSGTDFPEDFGSKPFQIDQLLLEISIRLKEINSGSSNAFSQLLYQIDLPESILPSLSQTDDFYLRLSEVILKREAYKVFLRSKYSS